MLTVLIAIICFVAGCVAAGLFQKNLFEKNYVPVSTFNGMNQQLVTIQTEKSMMEKNLSDAHSDYDELKLSCEEKANEVIRVTALLSQRSAEKEHIANALSEKERELDDETQLKNKLLNDLSANREQLIQANAELAHCKQKLSTQKEEVEQIGKKFEDAFKVLAQNILDDKSKKFSEEQERNLKGILEPL